VLLSRRAVLIAPVVAACAPQVAAPPAVASALPPAGATRSFVETRRAKVEIEAYGEGRTLVLLHPMPSSRDAVRGRYEPVFASRPGWRRVYPNLPGVGASTLAPEVQDFAAYADTVREVIEAIAPSGPVTLLGVSTGAEIAAAIAPKLGARLAGLALVSPPAPGTANKQKEAPATVEEPGVFAGLDAAAVARFKSLLTVRTARTRDALLAEAVSGAKLVDFARLQNVVLSEDDPAPPAPRFDGPALVLCGKQDTWCGFKAQFAMLEKMPRASYVALEHAAHALAFEQEGLARALVGDWLDRVAERLA
jgi:pimeloyl-ACP methyl ester carboxylesterase